MEKEQGKLRRLFPDKPLAAAFLLIGSAISFLLLENGSQVLGPHSKHQGASVQIPEMTATASIANSPQSSVHPGPGTYSRIVDEFGVERLFRRGVVLAKRRGGSVESILAEPGTESAKLLALRRDPNFEFAELDLVMTRQFIPSDPMQNGQWHHSKIGSSNAWNVSVGYNAERSPMVQLAILDAPFQMNHPDLRGNTAPGWSMIARQPIPLETNGYYHSTIAAGLAGAVIRNGVGGSGLVNCWLTPVDIGELPTTRDMHDAVIWAADHGIRVVNLSWDGAFSAVIDDAGKYLKEKARGMLFMAGVNATRFLNYPALPNIYAVSMTDTNDQSRSAWGNHIDFAAPGWDVFSTTTNSAYEADSGTSYSAPILAGMAAWIMSAQPEFGPAEVESVLREAAVDLGAPGWDQHFGWGRVDFGRAAALTFARSPVSRIDILQDAAIEAVYEAGTEYQVFRTDNLSSTNWTLAGQVSSEVVDGKIRFRDLDAGGAARFYKVQIVRPH